MHKISKIFVGIGALAIADAKHQAEKQARKKAMRQEEIARLQNELTNTLNEQADFLARQGSDKPLENGISMAIFIYGCLIISFVRG